MDHVIKHQTMQSINSMLYFDHQMINLNNIELIFTLEAGFHDYIHHKIFAQTIQPRSTMKLCTMYNMLKY